MSRSGARARPRVSYAPSSSSSNVWWIAAAVSVIWIAAVVAFSWARFALPNDPRSALDAAEVQIGFSDWLMIIAAILGPLLLIWVIAWLVRRSMELRDESRRLARAAILLADAAENAEKRAELMLPAPDSPAGELISMGPGHLHREIERANHAMSALQTQMSSMESALAKQAAAFDNAAEKSAERSRALNATTAAGAGLLAAGAGAAAAMPSAAEPARDVTGEFDGEVVAPNNDPKATAVDLAFQPNQNVEDLRQNLRTAGSSAGWTKLVDDKPLPKSPKSQSALESMRDDVAAIKYPKPQAPVQHPQAQQPNVQQLQVQQPNVQQPKSASVDPFDDLGPSAPKAAIGAAVGAGVATLGFGASRTDEPPVNTGPALGAPLMDEPAPAPAFNAKPAEPPKGDDFEFMARALDWTKFVKAANFPENERDTATLDALYDVLTDPEAAALLQSSEDTLATLADIDLYMEDFVPEMSPVAAWQAHAQGKRSITPITAPIEQSRIVAKINADEQFRKLSERFVERYSVVLKRLFAEEADGRLALELSDTRTGRAYLLIAGALGKL